ncbi:MAG: DNA polymerase domain-containing protein, partial [Patescibacteria group bacterium]
MKIEAFLFDVYADHTGMVLWVIDNQGKNYCLHQNWGPTLYLKINEQDKKNYLLFCKLYKNQVNISKTKKYDVYKGWQEVRAIKIKSPFKLKQITKFIKDQLPYSAFWQGNLDAAEMYLFEKQIFSLALCEFKINDQNEIQEIILQDDRGKTDYDIPPLKIMKIKMGGRKADPRQALPSDLEIEYEGQVMVLEKDEPFQIIENLNRLLENYDPDIILTRFGDSYIIPRLYKFCEQNKLNLHLNRDQSKNIDFGREFSYFSYGRILHRAGVVSLYGRVHIDQRNSFLYNESNLEGIFELARLSSLPLQKMARTSIGTAMSSMEYVTAFKNNIMIPTLKQEPEDFKSGEAHLLSDKGGLVFMPKVGFHENIVELDFASMYPTIMVKFNISPETINCSCCPDAPTVPEIGYRLCQKKIGIIPATLKPVLEKRAHYKKMQKLSKNTDEYNKYYLRQSALKWILVTCFGYLGYKNARFGKIDAHEAVTAFGREALLQAKDIAEDEGFEFLHAIVDSLWLKKNNFTKKNINSLCEIIEKKTKIPVSLEGIYKWICFSPSKIDFEIGAANRYYGCFTTGELKLRGIETRRHDTPPLINNFQYKILNELMHLNNTKSIEKNIPQYFDYLKDLLHNLFSGEINFHDLVITKNLSRNPEDFKVETHTAIAAKELAGRGMKLSAGQRIQYIITDAESEDRSSRVRAFGYMDADWSYDAKKYGELLVKAFATLFACFG